MTNATFWPNLLTSSRLVLVIPFLMFYPDESTRGLWLVGLLVACELTDAFDGMLARGLGDVLDFGKIFDPFADSVYRLSAFLALLLAGLFPLYAFMVLLFRDIAVSHVRVFEAANGHVRAARTSGKIKAVVQGVGLIILALIGIYGGQFEGPVLGYVEGLTVLAIVGITLWSLVDYAQPLFAKKGAV